MTAGQFREVDLDLLADFVGGALDGTPDEAEVARLVAEDPAWTQAYALLVPAVDAVRDSLAGWGTDPAPMPIEVTDRLVAALAAADPVAAPPAGEPGDRNVRRLSAVPAGQGGPAGRERDSTRRRRWSRLAGPVAVAAAVAAFAGFGVSRLIDDAQPRDATTAAAGSAPDAAGPELAPAGPGGPRALLEPAGAGVVSSGTNYAPDTLSERASAVGRQSPTRAGRPATDTTQKASEGPVLGTEQDRTMTAAAGLKRLVERDALGACLNAVAAEHGRGSLTVDLVDYASFEGAPALVITFADQSGDRWAWVAGPECGVPGSGADTRYQARVG